MTSAQLQIQAAYGKILKDLEATYNGFMADAKVNSQDYEGINADDAYVWFIESF